MAYKFKCPDCGKTSELQNKPSRPTIICPQCAKDVFVGQAKDNKGKILTLIFTFAAVLIGAILIFVYISVQGKKAEQMRLEEKRRAEAAARLKEVQRLQKIEEARKRWQETTKVANRDRLKTESDFVKALNTLKTYQGGDPDEKARLIRQIEEYKAADIAKIMTRLDEEAKAFGDKKEFLKAVGVYQDYSGDFKLDTEQLRKDGAQKYFDLEAEAKREAELAREKAEQGKKALLNDFAAGLISGKISASLAAYKDSPFKNESEEVAKIVNNLSKVNEIVLDSFKVQIGKEIPVNLRKGKTLLKIKNVEKGRIFAIFKTAKLEMIKKYSIKDLDDSEVISRLAAHDKATACVFAGVKACRKRQFEKAEKYFQETGELAVPLVAKMQEYQTSIPTVDEVKEKKAPKLIPIEARRIKVSLKVTRRSKENLGMGEFKEEYVARLDVKNLNQQAIEGFEVTIVIIGRSLVYTDEFKPICQFSEKLNIDAKKKFDKDIPVIIQYNAGAEIGGNNDRAITGNKDEDNSGPEKIIARSGQKYYSWLWVLKDPKGKIVAKKSKHSKFEKNAEEMLEGGEDKDPLEAKD